ncbi:TIM-barrel domain-containing protein [Stenotrophomonas bentonitica]|uniref:TIM-barrel domain-containing protein n=1 Tax=Stenotrophomonas bentonitica TaxID=1450134 RepID=A0ABU9JL91_9GAMM|nr:TIM-barrel domain-containing protein [Stenotrophomonas bentonitica]
MRYMSVLSVPLLALLASPAMAQSHRVLDNGVVVVPAQAGAAQVRLELVDDNIVRVSADPDGDFKRTPSLMRVPVQGKPRFTVEQGGGNVRLVAAGISAEISEADGHVSFRDAEGKPLLAERAGGRSFSPLSVEGKAYYSVRQRFESPSDEAIYGFGQHQQGWMNQKGRDVELLQGNIDMAVPFIVSSRNYGLLWDNNAITRLGDPRGLQPLQSSLQVFDAKGKAGALTARYIVDGKTRVERREPEVNYQYIKDLTAFPAKGRNAAAGGRSQVVWDGAIEAKTAGRHTFSLYGSEYIKLYVDGKLVIDRWRQNWNPWHHEFALELTPGTRHQIKVEWDLIDPSYIALLHRDPLPQAEAADLSLWSEAGQMVDYYVVAGGNADQVIAGYRELTGKAVMLPKWAYGFWQSRERYKSQDELLGVLDEYRRRKLPIDNIVLDWSYWPEDAWGSHDFDATHFPDPGGMVKHIHDQHAQVMISVWPKFYPTTANYKELDAAGFMYQRNVEVGELDWIGKGYKNSFYDPYAAKAQQIYWRQINEKLNSKGFDAWWMDADEPDVHSNLDIGERKARTTPTALGPSTEFFNSYPLPHTQGVYEGDRAADGQRVFILSRKGYAGTQRNAVAVWSGDIVSRWDDMLEQVSAGVNTAMSGLPNWTFDIGGFSTEKRYSEEDPAHLPEWRELNTRWFQFGAFVPLFRSHGQYPFREIWNIAPEGTPYYDSMVYYSRLRYTLLPYIYTLAADTWHRDGSIMRGLPMDFPSDPAVRDINDQYLFGPSLLVAPVTTFGATSRKVYLPAGTTWLDYYTGQRLQGGQTIDAAAPLERIPLYVRAGAIIPTGPVQQYVDEQPDAPLTVVVYTGADGAFSLYEDDGRSYGYEKGQFSRIPLQWNQATRELRIGKREGQWKGMQAQRTIQVRFVDGLRADAGALAPAIDQTVRYDGKAVVVPQRKMAAAR